MHLMSGSVEIAISSLFKFKMKRWLQLLNVIGGVTRCVEAEIDLDEFELMQ